jgi:DNA-binding PadR family transcriptional regulator
MNTNLRYGGRSPLALAILCLLAYEPMHPYRMQQLIKNWGKDLVINVGQRKTLYTTIDRLVRDGLVDVEGRSRQQAFPERTTYRLTEPGQAACRSWLRDMLATPRREYPEFPAAVSFLLLLQPGEVLAELDKRLTAIGDQLARIDGELAAGQDAAPRVSLLELEYLRAITHAEQQWLASVISDLRTGRLTWSDESLRGAAAQSATNAVTQQEDR